MVGGRERGHSFGVRAIRLWNAVSNSLKKIECIHSFKKAFIDFYASSYSSLLYFYCFITSYSQLLIVLFTVVFLIVIFRIILYIFSTVIVNVS